MLFLIAVQRLSFNAQTRCEMVELLLNSIALDPHRWAKDKRPSQRLDRLLPHIVDAGFHFVEVWQYHISEEEEAQIHEIRRIGDSLGLTFPVVGMYPQLHLAGEARDQEMERVRRLFTYAKTLGARVVKIFVGTQPGVSISKAEYDRSVAFMKGMAGLAKTFNLTLTGETHQKTLFDSIDSCRRFLSDVNDANFKVCFQPYDLKSTAQALLDYERLAKDVIHVHYQGRKGDRIELLENSDLDYRRLTQALAKKGFDGYICIEFTRDCVVPSPSEFDLSVVLKNAGKDRDFVLRAAQECRVNIST
jgi:sugar phosphate isomerase/epimerase